MVLRTKSKIRTVNITKFLNVFFIWLFSSLASTTIVHSQTNNPILLHQDDYASVSDEILSRRWPNGVVYFEIVNGDKIDNGTETRRQRFDRINKWEELSSGAVRFVESDVMVPRVEIILTPPDGGKNSTGGLRGIRENTGTLITGVRPISIRVDVSYSVHHELGHVLGRWHHQRHPGSGACLTLDPTAPSRLPQSHFIGRYTSNSIMQYGAPQLDYRTWVNDPATCPVMALTEDPSKFDILYFKKMYGVNGDYSNNTDWCKGPDTFIYSGDFNGDGLDDLVCHIKDGGNVPGILKIDYAVKGDPNIFADGDRADEQNSFCFLSDELIYVGDFNDDGIDDLLCFNRVSGDRVLNNTDSLGKLNESIETLPSFCPFQNLGADIQRQLYVGDYDGDGLDDMLCHTREKNSLSIDYARNGYNGSDWDTEWSVCADSQQVLITGKFDEGDKTDLLCHDTVSGDHWIIYADDDSQFGLADWSTIVDFNPPEGGFCFGPDTQIYAADMTGNGLDDLVCHDQRIGSISIDYAVHKSDSRDANDPDETNRTRGSELWFSNYFAELSFCNAQDAYLSIGRFPTNLDKEIDSLHCNNFATGHQAGRFSFSN